MTTRPTLTTSCNLGSLSANAQNHILTCGMGWFPNRPGGLNRYVYELTHTLAHQGDRLELCATDLPTQTTHPNLTLTNLSNSHSNLLKRWYFSQRNFSQRTLPAPDAINLHFALYSLPILNQLPKNTPITFTFHGPWADESNREHNNWLNTTSKRWIEQQVYNRCDRFITLSQAFANILHQTYRIPQDKIYIIPGGINTTQFQANLTCQQARQQLNFPTDRPILFTPRRLVHRMGIDRLLSAVALIKPQIPDIWLAIAGKGPLRESLELQVKELGLENHVKFLGYLPDEHLPIAYQAADLTVVPSQSLEGFGLILLESLASGTPVLATPVGGMPEVLRPFQDSLITDDLDEASIADRIISLLKSDIPLPSREACRQYACDHFDWSKIAPQVRQVMLDP